MQNRSAVSFQFKHTPPYDLSIPLVGIEKTQNPCMLGGGNSDIIISYHTVWKEWTASTGNKIY